MRRYKTAILPKNVNLLYSGAECTLVNLRNFPCQSLRARNACYGRPMELKISGIIASGIGYKIGKFS